MSAEQLETSQLPRYVALREGCGTAEEQQFHGMLEEISGGLILGLGCTLVAVSKLGKGNQIINHVGLVTFVTGAAFYLDGRDGRHSGERIADEEAQGKVIPLPGRAPLPQPPNRATF